MNTLVENRLKRLVLALNLPGTWRNLDYEHSIDTEDYKRFDAVQGFARVQDDGSILIKCSVSMEEEEHGYSESDFGHVHIHIGIDGTKMDNKITSRYNNLYPITRHVMHAAGCMVLPCGDYTNYYLQFIKLMNA